MKPEKKILINGYKHTLFEQDELTESEMIEESDAFYQFMNQRRSIREFSDKSIPKEVIDNVIKAASTAPSGAHKQPWTFCAVSNSGLKKKIRIAAEKEEKESYESRMSDKWLEDLGPLATDENKPFLEKAPWLIIVFKRVFEYRKDGHKLNNYYVNESVGLACGMLITAIHNAGLVTVTHTPSPMHFLTAILDRPDNERPFMILPIGYSKYPTYVPDLDRKSLDEVSEFYE
ncbi:MAG: nitroreductase family protein [Candidatus Delongbacteria bacterium]|jgi:iodotyrosine deiodinase|nr:nitroreductase family protein [Candidatus Delongbacteria bacterium]